MIKFTRMFLTMLFVFGLAVGASFAQEEIEVGDSVDGEADNEVVEYEVELEEGQEVEIGVESDDFDTYLILYDEDGDEVARDDDGGSGFNSLIEYEVEEDGTYTIAVGAFPGGSEADGDFELTVEEVGSSDDDDDDSGSSGGEIEIGDSIDGEADDEVVPFTFEMEEGQTVEINVESDDFDTYLTLFDEDGDEVASDDDGGDGLNSRIVYTAEDDGEFTVEVGAFPGGSEADGEFELELEEIEVEAVDSTELEFGEEIEIDVDDALSAEATFEASEGDVVTILVRSDAEQDLVLVLENEDGDEVARYDSFGAPALNRVELPDDGTYTLIITEWDDALLEDEIEIELFESEILDLNDGPQSLVLSDDVQFDYMVFEAEEDVAYAIFVSFEEAPESTVYVDLVEEDAFFADVRTSASGVDEIGMIFEVNDDGLMRIEFEYFGFGGDDVELTAEIVVME